MREIVADAGLVAHCGLYCGACRAYLKERCPGCHENVRATWCKIRSCCAEHDYATCADCEDFPDPNDCRKFNNIVAKVFGLLFRSNRAACIQLIKDEGYDAFAERMTREQRQSLPR